MDTLLRDLRYLVRSLRSNRGFSSVVILTIAVAVAASTALFSVVNPLLIRAEPYAEPERLVALWESPPRADGGVAPGKNEVSAGTYADWIAEGAVFDGVAAVATWRPNLTGGDEPIRGSSPPKGDADLHKGRNSHGPSEQRVCRLRRQRVGTEESDGGQHSRGRADRPWSAS